MDRFYYHPQREERDFVYENKRDFVYENKRDLCSLQRPIHLNHQRCSSLRKFGGLLKLKIPTIV